MNSSVPHTHVTRPAASTSRLRSCSVSHMLDDNASEEVHRLADRLAGDLEAIRRAIDVVSRSTYEEVNLNRRRARQMVLEAWRDLAGVARALSEPAPKFRANVTSFRPLVRRKVDDEVADFRPVALPAALEAGR